MEVLTDSGDPPRGSGSAQASGRSPLERVLFLFTDVAPGEGPAAMLMLVSVFLVLAAYYCIKPARDGLLAVSPVGALSETEIKAYSSFGQSLLLLGVLPLYDRLWNALPRRELVTYVPLFFAANLVAFWSLQPDFLFSRVGFVGIVFYLWVGVFNVFMIALFWAFATDLYPEESGKRLLPMVAIGATAGAATGAWLSKELVTLVGTYALLLGAALLLGISVVSLRAAEARAGAASEKRAAAPADVTGGYGLIRRHPYLAATALLVLTLNWVNTNGENLMFGAVEKQLHQEVVERGITDPAAVERYIRDQTTRFYSDLFFWVNVVALLLQSLVAARLLRYGGFGVLLLVMPVVSLVAYSSMALFPYLSTIKRMKIVENATDYSINNTAKQVLWLPTSPAMKYKAKAAVDTIFVRCGDVLAALTAFVGLSLWSVPLPALFAFNAVLVVLWLILGAIVVRERRRLVQSSLTRDGDLPR